MRTPPREAKLLNPIGGLSFHPRRMDLDLEIQPLEASQRDQFSKPGYESYDQKALEKERCHQQIEY